jgi:O-acetyl-ADP-ribose deacetylase (regulator of RNase III)
LKADLPGGLLPRGQAIATTGGRLPARWVIHTAGPVYEQPGGAQQADLAGVGDDPSENRSSILRSCYVTSLLLASELGATSIAFPAISAGVYGWPIADAARVAVNAVRDTDAPGVTLVRFALFGPAALQAFRAALGD